MFRLGLLRQLLARAVQETADTGHHISDLALPVTDAALWRCLMCLPVEIALPLALQALGQRTHPDAQAKLVALSQRNGVGATLLTYLDGRGDPLMSHPKMAAVHQLLRDPDERQQALAPIALNTDLVPDLAEHGSLQLSGFHPAEPGGVWTAEPKAQLTVLVPKDAPATLLSGSASLLEAALDQAAQTITVNATEKTTGRHTRWQDTRPQGGDPSFDWALPLPGFSGPLQVELSLPACHSPRALGASPDPRPLGMLLRSLRFETDQTQLAAAE